MDDAAGNLVSRLVLLHDVKNIQLALQRSEHQLIFQHPAAISSLFSNAALLSPRRFFCAPSAATAGYRETPDESNQADFGAISGNMADFIYLG